MKISALLLLLLPVVAHAQSPEDRIKALEDRLNKLDAPKGTSTAFNPSIGMALDTIYRQAKSRGNAVFRAAEINLGADVDPFVKAWAIINGNPGGVEVEEAAMRTTALPYNLTVTGGRVFASFGRLAHFHDHELPVPERPRSLDTFIGGETQADGVEVTYLVPTPFYLSATVGAFNKIGGDNTRADNAVDRTADEFTYLGRLVTSADLGDDHSLELGVHSAWTPKRTMQEDVAVSASGLPPVTTRKNTWRTLHGADLTYRYHPSAGSLSRGLLWSTEVMQNNERRFDPADPSSRLPTDRVKAFGGFSYVQAKVGRHWRPGVMLDLAEDLDVGKTITRTWTGFVTYDVTEFNRLRLAYSYVGDNAPATLDNKVVALQWSVVLGYHVHGFRDR